MSGVPEPDEPNQTDSRGPFDRLIPRRRARFRDPDGLDLLAKMLVVDHKERITADEALEHPFFAECRDGESSSPESS